MVRILPRGYDSAMRFRLGMAVGFASGYYLGARAGRERYEQINKTIRKVKGSETFDVAADKARAVVDLGMERARDAVESTISSATRNGAGDMGHRSPPAFPNPRVHRRPVHGPPPSTG